MNDRTAPWDMPEVDFYSPDFIPPRDNSINKHILDSPKSIYNYLSKRCYGQEDYKKALSIFVYRALQGIQSGKVILVSSPSGTGKTYMATVLSELFDPQHVAIADCSGMVATGYRSGNYVTTPLAQFAAITDDKPCFVFYDEWDKLLYKSNNAWQETNLISEFLKITDSHSTKISINTDEKKPISIDSKRIFYVFLGSFSDISSRMHKPKPIGFNADIGSSGSKLPTQVTKEQILELLTPELQGRISKIITVPPMTEQDFVTMFKDPRYNPASQLARELGISITVSTKRMRQFAKYAFESGTGVRGVRNAILEEVDKAFFANPNMSELYIK